MMRDHDVRKAREDHPQRPGQDRSAHGALENPDTAAPPRSIRAVTKEMEARSAEALLATITNDAKPAVCVTAARALQRGGAARVEQALVKLLLESPDHHRRLYAALALGGATSSDATAALCTALERDGAEGVRRQVATSLTGNGDPRAAMALARKGLTDEVPAGAEASARALRGVTDAPALAYLREHIVVHGDETLRALGAVALQGTTDQTTRSWLHRSALTHSDAEIALCAARSLLGASDDASRQALCAHGLTHADARVRGAAVSSLGAIHDEATISWLLMTGLTHEEPHVRYASIFAARRSADDRLKHALVERLSDTVPGIRGVTHFVLSGMEDLAIRDIVRRAGQADPRETFSPLLPNHLGDPAYFLAISNE